MPDTVPLRCYRCRAPGPSSQCGGCKTMVYCSSGCQKEDWATHKKQCKVIQQYPPPAGFYPGCHPFESLQRLTFVAGLPVYPTTWALQRARTTTPVALDLITSFAEYGHPAEQLDKNYRDAIVEQKNLFEGLSKDLAYMKLVDAYRNGLDSQAMCAGIPFGQESVYTPSLHSFRYNFLDPLTYLPHTEKSVVLPTYFPSSPGSVNEAVVQEFVEICGRFGTTIDRTGSMNEALACAKFGGMLDLANIYQGTVKGLENMGLSGAGHRERP